MPTVELSDLQVRILRCATNGMDEDNLKIDLWLMHGKVISKGELGLEVDELRSKLGNALDEKT